MDSSEFRKKFFCMLIGVLGMGVFLSFILQVGYGSDTSSFMNNSIASRFNLSFGTTMIVTNAILFIPELIWGRKLIGFGTIANMTLIGYTSDFCTMLENRYLPEEMFTEQPYRVITFIAALATFLFFVSIYMNAGMGQAPFDAVPTMASEKLKLPFKYCRMCWDFLAIIIGMAAGGHLTVATVILAFTVGPTVSFLGKAIRI